MNADKYPVLAFEDSTRFEFLSEGPKGTIKKVVHYQFMAGQVFNLAFGDWNEEQRSISDLSRSNNGDRDKVLATVAFTLIEFIHYHLPATVFIKGSTGSRTRLYQIGIKNSWLEISHFFNVKGYRNDGWEDFATAKNYDAFTLSAKEKL